MSRMLIFLSIAIVLFSVAAGASWYLQYQQSQDNEAPHAADDKAHKAPNDAAHAKKNAKDTADHRLAPVVRPPIVPEADRMTQMAATLQTQQESLRNREEALRVREKHLDLIHEEIRKEQKKLESVRKDVDTELQIVMEKLDLLEKRSGETEKERQKADAQMDDIRRSTLELNGLESKNLKQVASIYDKMDAEAAAQSIQQMVEKGKLDTAVSILAGMRDRQAASLLGELSKQDASIAVQLFDKMRYLKTPGSTSK